MRTIHRPPARRQRGGCARRRLPRLGILVLGTLLGPAALSAATTYFLQDFTQSPPPADTLTWDDLIDSTYIYSDSSTAFPHTQFNYNQGSSNKNPPGWSYAQLDTTRGVNGQGPHERSLRVKYGVDENWGRTISYYLGGIESPLDTASYRYEYFGGGWGQAGSIIRDGWHDDVSELFLRYYVRFDANFTTEDTVINSGKIPGLAGTYRAGAGGYWPNTTDSLGWSARLGWFHDAGTPQDTLQLGSYVYHLNQHRKGRPPGENGGDEIPEEMDDDEHSLDFTRAPKICRGQWYRIEQRVKMNTYYSGVADTNGITEVWLNGQRQDVMCRYNLAYTVHDTVCINRLWADLYYGGRRPSPVENYLNLDDFYLSDQPSPWYGTLVGDTVWQDSVTVTGDVIVPEGVTLTIVPDTQVRFASGDVVKSGADTTRSGLYVRGTLKADQATFCSLPDIQYDGWSGITIDSCANVSASYIRGCTIEDAVVGVSAKASSFCVGAPPDSGDGNTFRTCEYGVALGSYTAPTEGCRVTGNTFTSCMVGVYQSSSSEADTVDHNLLIDVGETGLFVIGDDLWATNNTVHCGSYLNTAAVWVYGGDNAVIANTTADSCYRGIKVTGGTARPHHFLSFANTYDMSGISASNARAVVDDPRFVAPGSETGNYHLHPISTAIDLGDSSMTDSAEDTTRINLGYLGGTRSADSGSTTTLIEDYFVDGVANGWTPLSGTWISYAAEGCYLNTGTSRARKQVGVSDYIVQARMCFWAVPGGGDGGEGKLIWRSASQHEYNRVDLLAAQDSVRLVNYNDGVYKAPYQLAPGVFYTVAVQADHDSVLVYVDGVTDRPNGARHVRPNGATWRARFGGLGTGPDIGFLDLLFKA